MSGATIEIRDVCFRYRSETVLSGLSLGVRAGEVLALLGPSGSGKTSALRAVLGFAVPERGLVRIDGRIVSEAGRLRVPPEERGLGVVFQDLALWPHLTVEGNMAFGLAAQGVPREERRKRIADMLHRVDLGGKGDRHPGELSGGERQRVALGRALVLEPRAVLLDEPLTNLDAVLRGEMILLLRELLAEHGATAIYVTHDVREAASLGDRIAVLLDGRIVQAGRLEELRARPARRFVRDLFRALDP